MNTCRLCLRKNVKLCNSHIFPEFLYGNLYDTEGHFYDVFSSKQGHRPSRRRQGIYEKLLCSACEAKLSRWENYAKGILFHKLHTPSLLTDEYFVVQHVQYQEFKLFLLSLLWRAGITSRPEFKNASLGEHESVIRQMLHTESPGEPLDYPVILFIMRRGFKPLMVMPSVYRSVLGISGFRTTMLGFTWMFVIGRHKQFPALNVFLDKQGNLPLVKDNGKGMEFLNHWIRKLHV